MVACPKCNAELAIPEDVQKDSIFDCPHCQATYPLSEAASSIPSDGDDGAFLFDLDANDVEGVANAIDDALDVGKAAASLPEATHDQATDPVAELSDMSGEPIDDELDELDRLDLDLDLSFDAEAPIEAPPDVVQATDAVGMPAEPASNVVDELDEWLDDNELPDEADSTPTKAETQLDVAALEAELFPESAHDTDLELELQSATNQVEAELDEPASESFVADEVSAAAEEALRADNADLTGVEDLTAQMVDDAIKSEPADEMAVQVVKPFDLPPTSDQVAAKNFQPKIPRRGGLLPAALKFGVGGLLGLVLCQAGLWWIGHADPLGLVAYLPESLSVLAPEQVRKPYQTMVANRPPSLDNALVTNELPQPPGSDVTGDASATPADPVPPVEDPADRASAFPVNEDPSDENSVAPADDSAIPADASPPSDVTPSSAALPANDLPPAIESSTPIDVLPVDESALTAGPSLPQPLTNGTALPTNPLETASSVSEAVDAESDVFATDHPPSIPTIGLAIKRELHRNDLGGALGKTRGALTDLLDAGTARASREVREKLMLDFYDAALELAEHANHVGDDGAPVLTEVQSFLEGISKYGKVIGKAAARRLPDSDRDGVFLAGSITDQETLDTSYQRVEVTLFGDRPQQYAVVAPVSLTASIGDQVFVLGVRVADPATEIAGFTSPIEGQLVWSEHFIPLP